MTAQFLICSKCKNSGPFTGTCPACGSKRVVPVDSRLGEMYVAERDGKSDPDDRAMKIIGVATAIVVIGGLIGYGVYTVKKDEEGSPVKRTAAASPSATPDLDSAAMREVAFRSNFPTVNEDMKARGLDVRVTLEGADRDVIRFSSHLCTADEDGKAFLSGAIVASRLGDTENRAAMRKFGFRRVECFNGSAVTFSLQP
jgi:hypothetical protein